MPKKEDKKATDEAKSKKDKKDKKEGKDGEKKEKKDKKEKDPSDKKDKKDKCAFSCTLSVINRLNSFLGGSMPLVPCLSSASATLRS